VGGALLVVGLFTRVVAFVTAGEMAVAYWMVHAPASFYPVLNHGEPAILFCFVFLLFVFACPRRLDASMAFCLKGRKTNL
jgi:putative oxidoreductase